MPVDGCRLHGVVMSGGELAAHRPEEDDTEHDDAAQDVRPVEAGQGEERGPERAIGETEPELAVVVALADEEGDPHDKRHGDGPDEAAPVIPPDRPDAQLAGERA